MILKPSDKKAFFIFRLYKMFAMKQVILLLLFPMLLIAQAGHNDPSFNPSDSGYANGANYHINDVVALDNGQSIVVGRFTHYYGMLRGRIARINPDESLDATFNAGMGANETINVVIVQPDGKILIGGQFTQYNGTPTSRIARLNADGTIDPTFNVSEGFDGQVWTICLQADGKILVGGSFNNFDNMPAPKLTRLNSDGSPDASFIIGSGMDNTVRTIAVQPDGKILAGGDFTHVGFTSAQKIVRLTAAGSVDSSFVLALPSGIDDTVKKIVVQPDQKVLVGGSFYVTFYGLLRLLPSGAIDSSLVLPENFHGNVNDMDVLADGKIIISGGNFQVGDTNKFGLFRINNDGSLDPNFQGSNHGVIINTTAVHANGRLVCGGEFDTFDNQTRSNLVSLTADGAIDPTAPNDFGVGFDASVCAIRVQQDDKIIACGDFQHFHGVPAGRIMRLLPDGTADTSFAAGVGFDGRALYCLIQPDGKILVYGEFTSYNGVPRNGLARINGDGSLDLGFNPASGFSGTPHFYAMALQPDGKILIASSGWSVNATVLAPLVRFNADGSADNTFVYHSPSGLTAGIYNVIPLPSGKMIVERRVILGSANDSHKICRHNEDGSVDSAFTPIAVTQGGISPGAIAVTPSGGFYFAFRYNFGNSFPNLLRRYTADGLLDTSFPTVSLGSYYPMLKLMENGQILMGYLTDMTTGYQRFSRINIDGTIDAGFASPDFGGFVESFDLQSDGKIIVAGHYTHFDGVGRNRIARILNDSSMGIKDATAQQNSVQMFCQDRILGVVSQTNKIVSVEIFEPSGRKIAAVNNINQVDVRMPLSQISKWAIVRVTTDNQEIEVRKLALQ